MRPGERKRPPTLFEPDAVPSNGLRRQCSDPKKQKRHVDPPGQHGNYQRLNTQSRRTLVNGMSRPRSEVNNNPAETQRSLLQGMGRTNEGAIAIDSDDDDDEIEMVFTVRGHAPPATSRAPRPLKAPSMLRRGLFKSVVQHAFPSRREVAPDPAGSSLSRSPTSSTQSSTNERHSAGLRASASVTTASTEQGKEQNPILLDDIDTEEEFQQQEDEVEVIAIDDSDEEDSGDDDDDDDFLKKLEAYSQSCTTRHQKSPSRVLSSSGQQSPVKTPSNAGADAASPYAQAGQHYRGRSNPQPLLQASKLSAAGSAGIFDACDVCSSDDEIEVWDAKDAPALEGSTAASGRAEKTAHDPSDARKALLKDAWNRKLNSMQLMQASDSPSVAGSNNREEGGCFRSAVASMPAGQGTIEPEYESPSKVKKCAARIKSLSFEDEEDLADTDSETGNGQLIPSFSKTDSEPYSCKEFARLWRDAERDVGKTDVLEKQKNFQKTKSTEQYGKILPKGMRRIFNKVMGLKREHVFIDIGSGIANLTLQAAYTIGCESKGIECVEGRCDVADKFQVAFEELANQHKNLDGMTFEPGKVDLKRGELQDQRFRSWIVDGTDFVFCNNFGRHLGGSFSGVRDGSPSLDGHVAALFAMMKEGAVLVTLSPLISALGCLTLTLANVKRRQKGLPESDNASFYELKKHRIGKQRHVASWSEGSGCEEQVTVYRYTRTKQSAGEAVLLCNNPECENAVLAIPIPAVVYDDDGAASIGFCQCRITDRPVRRRRRTVPYGKKT